MLTAEQIQRYKTDGFIVVPDVYEPDFVRRMQQVVDGLVERSRGIAQHDATFDLEPGHSAERPKVRRIKTPHKVDPVFTEAYRHPKLIAIMRDLLGPNVRMMNSKLNLKEAGDGSPVEWHQDWAFYPHTNDDILAVGVMIDDCRMENGPLLLLPGTHTGPTFNHHHADGYFVGAMDPEASGLDYSKAVPCVGRAGSISIHHVRAVHGSAENTSPDPRRLLLYQIMAADAWPLTGVPDLADHESRMMCGESTIEPRMVPVPTRMPQPPAPNQGSIYENQTSAKNRFFKRAGETTAA